MKSKEILYQEILSHINNADEERTTEEEEEFNSRLATIEREARQSLTKQDYNKLMAQVDKRWSKFKNFHGKKTKDSLDDLAENQEGHEHAEKSHTANTSNKGKFPDGKKNKPEKNGASVEHTEPNPDPTTDR